MKTKILLSALIAGAVVVGLLLAQTPAGSFGSVAASSGYMGTTTNNTVPNYFVLSSSTGVLGQVTITDAGTGALYLYDSTSTNTNAEWATTTLAAFKGATAAGTYTFDRVFSKGLLIVCNAGCAAVGSTTITWRKE